MPGDTTPTQVDDKTTSSGGSSSPDDAVTLDRGTYEALLDQIAELEATSTAKASVDDLTKDLEPEPKPKPAEFDLGAIDQMSNSQLATFIIDIINEQGGAAINELSKKLESITVLREIERAESKHDDFWQHEKDVRRIAMKNPSLTIEEAYKLAKAEAAEKGTGPKSDGDPPPKTKTERVLRLPPRGAVGERPSHIAGATTTGKSSAMTLRAAALSSWDEIVGKDKESI